MSPTLREAFGQAVRALRSQRGWSQEALAEHAHLHRTYVSAIERGERNVSLDNIDKLGRALGVSISDLFAAAEEVRSS